MIALQLEIERLDWSIEYYTCIEAFEMVNILEKDKANLEKKLMKEYELFQLWLNFEEYGG